MNIWLIGLSAVAALRMDKESSKELVKLLWAAYAAQGGKNVPPMNDASADLIIRIITSEEVMNQVAKMATGFNAAPQGVTANGFQANDGRGLGIPPQGQTPQWGKV